MPALLELPTENTLKTHRGRTSVKEVLLSCRCSDVLVPQKLGK